MCFKCETETVDFKFTCSQECMGFCVDCLENHVTENVEAGIIFLGCDTRCPHCNSVLPTNPLSHLRENGPPIELATFGLKPINDGEDKSEILIAMLNHTISIRIFEVMQCRFFHETSQEELPFTPTDERMRLILDFPITVAIHYCGGVKILTESFARHVESQACHSLTDQMPQHMPNEIFRQFAWRSIMGFLYLNEMERWHYAKMIEVIASIRERVDEYDNALPASAEEIPTAPSSPASAPAPAEEIPTAPTPVARPKTRRMGQAGITSDGYTGPRTRSMNLK